MTVYYNIVFLWTMLFRI